MGKLSRVRTLFQQFNAVDASKYLLLDALRSLLDSHATTSYGQRGEDCIIRSMLAGVEKGFYIDVGCFHPTQYSNTFYLYKHGWRGITIDANPEMIKKFRRVRPKDLAVCAVVSEEKKKEEMYLLEEEPAVNTLHPSYVDEYGRGPVVTEEVTTDTLDSILEEHNVPDSIHLLNLDIEGNELSALKSIDLTRYQPWIICVEMHEDKIEDAETSSVREHLYKNGYRFSGYATVNGYFVHNDKLPL